MKYKYMFNFSQKYSAHQELREMIKKNENLIFNFIRMMQNTKG